jgi:hypothetical protein
MRLVRGCTGTKLGDVADGATCLLGTCPRTRSRDVAGRDMTGAELPAAVAADADLRHLEPLGIERGDDRPRRREGDLVLARAAAREHDDAQAAPARAHPPVVVGGGGGPLNCPT